MSQTDINCLGLGAEHTAAQQWLAQYAPYLNYLQSVDLDTSSEQSIRRNSGGEKSGSLAIPI